MTIRRIIWWVTDQFMLARHEFRKAKRRNSFRRELRRVNDPREQVRLAVDHLVAVRLWLDDPSGKTTAYKREASTVVKMVVDATGAPETTVRNRIARGIARRI